MVKKEVGNAVCAGFVSYNPDVDLLKKAINAISFQVEKVLVVDNGSVNIESIDIICRCFENVEIIRKDKNLGIACALNTIGEYALKNNYEWFLTLDQDSVCDCKMIERYLQYVKNGEIGMICPRIGLRIHKLSEVKVTKTVEDVTLTITSGCLVNVNAWQQAGYFWNYLFIDKVDDDFCFALRNCGKKILKVNDVVLEHEIGNPQKHSFFGRTFYTDAYTDFRYYYIARNTIIVNKCYKNTGYNLYHIFLIRILKILLGETGKIGKLVSLYKGIIAGVKWGKEYGVRGVPSQVERKNV